MHVDKLIEHGAECVAGDIIQNGKSLGRLYGGEFVPSEHGLKRMSELAEAADAPPVAAKKVAAKKVAKPKVEAPADEAPPADDGIGDLDDLLGGE